MVASGVGQLWEGGREELRITWLNISLQRPEKIFFQSSYLNLYANHNLDSLEDHGLHLMLNDSRENIMTIPMLRKMDYIPRVRIKPQESEKNYTGSVTRSFMDFATLQSQIHFLEFIKKSALNLYDCMWSGSICIGVCVFIKSPKLITQMSSN